MKTLILIPQLPVNINFIKGGTHSALLNLLKGFSDKETNVRVVSFSKEVSQPTVLHFSENIEIHYEKEGFLPFHSLNYFFFGPGILQKHINEFKPDVIHFQTGNSFFFVKRKLKVQNNILLTLHGMSFEEAKRKIKYSDKLKWYFNGIINELTICDNIIHLSIFSKKKIKNKVFKKEAIIHNAIDPVFFDIPVKLKVTNKLLYIGVIDNNKNLLHLLKSMKKLIGLGIHYHLEIIGDFNTQAYKKIIEDFVDSENLHQYVSFKGWSDRTQVVKSISDSDILVVSSFHESLPMAIAETMASARMVVASAVGGIAEMITDKENGFLFQLDQPDSLIEILKNVYLNQNTFDVITNNARKSAFNKFHASSIAEKTINFYNRIINE